MGMIDLNLTEFDIIIQGGQSNAEGMGLGEIENAYQTHEDVYYLTAEKTVEHRPERVVIDFVDKPFQVGVAEERLCDDGRVGEFSLYFARKYIQDGRLQKGRKLLIIRAGVGGTGFKKGHWCVGDELYNKMIEMTDYALSLNKNNQVIAFLWHQGEHDAFEKNVPENYKKQLTALVDGVRSHVGAKIPFIAGEFVNDWTSKNIDICAPILKVIREVVAEIGNGGFVETSDLLSNAQKIQNADDIHFCRESLHILGRRYFAEYKRIIGE